MTVLFHGLVWSITGPPSRHGSMGDTGYPVGILKGGLDQYKNHLYTNEITPPHGPWRRGPPRLCIALALFTWNHHER